MNEQHLELPVKLDNGSTLMDEFRLKEDVAELAKVDDLWYFIKKASCWIVGTDNGC